MISVQEILGSNPYFSAGAGVVGLTAASGLALKGASKAAFYLKRRLLVTIEIPIKDGIYPWFLEWMARRNQESAAVAASRQSLLERLFSQRFHQLQVETRLTKHENGSISSSFSLVPGNGKHFLKYKNAWFQVERNRTSSMMNMTSGVPWETVSVTSLARDRDLFLDMLQEARAHAMAQNSGKTIVYTAFGHEWRPFGNPRKKRPLASVVLSGRVSLDILEDVKTFLSSSQWYTDRGIPYRRGYLLHGPPGSGKSSYIQSLAGELDYDICIMNLADPGMTDDRFAHLLNNVPPKCMILLEDIDAAFINRSALPKATSTAYLNSNSLTLSGLLNGLDGVVAAEERLVFMTTNHVERLDPALARPGRCDYKVYLGNVTRDQAQVMFSRFYSAHKNVDAIQTAFLKRMEDLKLFNVCSPATLQSHFIIYRDNADEAVAKLETLNASVQ